MKRWWPFHKTYKVKCPDGSEKIVYRNVDDAFPLHIPGWQGNIQANVDAAQNMPISLRGEYATKIQGLLYALSDLNQSLMMAFRGSYIVYKNDPCGKSDFFERQIENLLKEQYRLQILSIQIQGLISLAELQPNNTDAFITVFKDLVSQIGGAAVREAAKLEIDESKENAKKWITGQIE